MSGALEFRPEEEQSSRETTNDRPLEMPWQEDEQKYLEEDSMYKCHLCGGEIGVRCHHTKDPRQPFPCGCEGTPRMGMCDCDIFVCRNCGMVVSMPGRQIEVQREVTVNMPIDFFGRSA